MSNSTKKIRSMSPDITVVVGKGMYKHEFECYKVALSLASPVFDAMLSSDMAESNNNQIQLSDKDPDQWQKFYGFIIHDDAVRINEENALILTPWFHEYEMKKALDECDNVLSNTVDILSKNNSPSLKDRECVRFWKGEDSSTYPFEEGSESFNLRKNNFGRIITLLEIACMYDLSKTKHTAESFISYLMGHGGIDKDKFLKDSCDLFDLKVITSLIELSLPLVDDSNGEEEEKKYVSVGKAKSFYQSFNDEFQQQLGQLPLDTVNNNIEMLSLLVSFYIKQQVMIQRVKAREWSKLPGRGY